MFVNDSIEASVPDKVKVLPVGGAGDAELDSEAHVDDET